METRFQKNEIGEKSLFEKLSYVRTLPQGPLFVKNTTFLNFLDIIIVKKLHVWSYLVRISTQTDTNQH